MELKPPINMDKSLSEFRKSWDFQILSQDIYDIDFEPAGNTLFFNDNTYYFSVVAEMQKLTFEINEFSPMLTGRA